MNYRISMIASSFSLQAKQTKSTAASVQTLTAQHLQFAAANTDLLEYLEKITSRLLERCANSIGKPMSQKRREKFAKYESQTIKYAEHCAIRRRFIDMK